MAYEESAKERTERKAREAENKAKADAKERERDDAMLKPAREAGEAAVKGMQEGRMDAMGNVYKAGGKVSSASARADGCAIRGKTRA
jgi:hypothetical protein